MNHWSCNGGLVGKPAYAPWFQMLIRIWKNPALSDCPAGRFRTPDSTSAAITGSSPGMPRSLAP
jgi:hypothetical protein